MIIGIGNDICDIRRIEKSISRFGDRFINRIFSDAEIAKANRRKENTRNYASTFAKRFAAKEAFMKAVGTGYSHGVHFKKISVVNDKVGKPMIELSQTTKSFVENMTEGKEYKVHVTMTDDYPHAFAVVIIEVI